VLCRFLRRLVHVPAEVLFHHSECLNAKITPFWTNVLEFVVSVCTFLSISNPFFVMTKMP
jgi:hypothetical protein